MKHGLLHAFGFVAAAWLALGAGSAAADATGPYYATPSWDQQLPASTRFIVLSNWGSAAVLDRETGLVWERSPSADGLSWFLAQGNCDVSQTGGRMGWRLPTVQELASLVDPSVAVPGPTLPIGHPFQNVQTSLTSVYWSATTNAELTSEAWGVIFRFGSLSTIDKSSTDRPAWCVRGGQGVDPQ